MYILVRQFQQRQTSMTQVALLQNTREHSQCARMLVHVHIQTLIQTIYSLDIILINTFLSQYFYKFSFA